MNNRANKILKMTFISVVIIIALVPFCSMADVGTEDLFFLINEARLNPLEAISKVGLDPDEVLKENPELSDILINGLPALTKHSSLDEAANDHAEDMLANGYFSSISLNGKSVSDRLRDVGYIAAQSDESIGMISFINFMPKSNAVYQIFKTMLRDELKVGYAGKRKIFNPDMMDLGIAVASGVMPIGGRHRNVYLAVCDYGTEWVGEQEGKRIDSALTNLINQARQKPLDVAMSIKHVPDTLIDSLPQLEIIQAEGLFPIWENELLSQVISRYADNRAVDGNMVLFKLDTDELNSLAEDAGFNGQVEAVSQVVYFTDEPVPAKWISMYLFKSLFSLELFSKKIETGVILNTHATDIGLSVRYGTIKVGETTKRGYVAHVLVAKSERIDPNIKLQGVIYEDLNLDGLYAPNEGIVDAEILYEKKVMSLIFIPVGQTLSGATGEFSFADLDGLHRLTVNYNGFSSDKLVWVSSRGKFVTLKLNVDEMQFQ
jgi:hypothetical protein